MERNMNLYAIIGLILLIAIAFVWFEDHAAKPVITVSPPGSLPGLAAGNAPWLPELDHLRERLSAIGLPILLEEGTALHIHEHLDIFIDGRAAAVPADIGVNEAAGFISPIHTHDDTAIIHVESPKVAVFTLGQFFDVWGVKFTDQCLGGYCGQGDKKLKVFVNGKLVSGDPRNIELQERQDIVVAYGTDQELPNPVPAAYSFPADL